MPSATSDVFSSYREFNETLRALVSASDLDDAWSERVTASLDGAAGTELRRLVDLTSRRAHGAFFTGSALAERLLRRTRFLPHRHFIYDPTVGAGDLLLAAARRLPCARTASATLRAWGRCLAGTDLHEEFVEAVKLRLALLARQRHGSRRPLPASWRDLLPYITRGNGLEQKDLFARSTHLLMNPPYNLTAAPRDCRWAHGRISQAALFVIRALEMASPGTRLFAVLPDVLRAGSFQHHWRGRVGDLATFGSVERYGIFDNSADVDVFLLAVRRSASRSGHQRLWPGSEAAGRSTVGDYFDVHVGRVVPHRDPEEGEEHPYIHPRIVPVWEEMTRFSEVRRHQGRPYQPPFTVLRRTSRPGDRHRAAATVVLGTTSVAVENHLIVCEPRDGSPDTCRALLRHLQTNGVSDFLDQRIRCRHLTVAAVAAIPFERR
jgi:hypothetical protein